MELEPAGWWVAFATHTEAEYPRLFCKRYASCVARHVDSGALQSSHMQFRANSLAMQNRQRKTNRQLIPEFSAVEFRPEGYQPLKNEKMLQPHLAGVVSVVDEVLLDEDLPCPDASAPEAKQSQADQARVGVYFDCVQHMQRALQLQHPMDTRCSIPDILKVAVFNMMTWGHATLAKHLSDCLSQDIRAAVDLAKQEAVLQKSLDEAVSAVVGGKRLLLFKRLLEITHFPDMRVVEIMMKGVDLTGIEPESPLFARKFRSASKTEPVLEKAAVRRRRRLMGSSKEDAALDSKRLQEISREEVSSGFLKGPFDYDSVAPQVGSEDWSMSRRFLLRQGEEGKERVIDDLKESCVNACYASVSKLDLHDVDFVSALFLFVAKLLQSGPVLRVRLASGQELVGHVHESVRADSALQARCLDLSKAYKQVPVAPSSHKRLSWASEQMRAHGNFMYASHCRSGLQRAYLSSTRSREPCGGSW